MVFPVSTFWLCFVPLFVAVDAVGTLPIYLALTEGFSRAQRRRVLVQSVVTALAVAVGFLFVGQWVFRLLGITVADFMVAGGLLLLAFATTDLLSVEKVRRKADPQSVGAVPIGVPLTVGPAVLTTIILLGNQHGRAPTVLALVVNVALAGAVFWFGQWIDRVLGRTGIRTVSKIANLILAAIGVMMIRLGISTWLGPTVG
jgi:multiple antibiotic resistance protein